MPERTPIDPPILVTERSGLAFQLSSVGAVIEYVRRIDAGHENWKELRRAAFVAAAVPSPENIEVLRARAIEAFATHVGSTTP